MQGDTVLLVQLQAGKPVTEDALRDIKPPVLQEAAPRALAASAAPAQQQSHPGRPQGQHPASAHPAQLPNASRAPNAGPVQPAQAMRPTSSAPAPVSLLRSSSHHCKKSNKHLKVLMKGAVLWKIYVNF